MSSDSEVRSVEIYDENNNNLLNMDKNYADAMIDIDLKPGERLIGVRSMKDRDADLQPRQYDLVFVIGWLEEEK